MQQNTHRIRACTICFIFIAFIYLTLFGTETAEGSPFNQTEARVKQYFADIPEMIEIGYCESGFRQYGPNGEPLRGGWLNKMIGLFQLHEDYHRNAANIMGHDINTLEGNLWYARHLFQAEGTRPWISSSNCWENKVKEAKNFNLSENNLTKDDLERKIEKLKKQVYILQIKLLEAKIKELQIRLDTALGAVR